MNEIEITLEDKKKIEKLSKNQDIFNLITSSIIPSIYGHNDIKEALSLLLFGGVLKQTHNKITISSGINILIVGDPGIGKSHLLKGVSKISLNGIYIDSNKSYVNGIYRHLSDKYDLQNFDESIFDQENLLICIDSLVVKPDDVVFLKDALGKKSNFNTKEELLNILNSKCSVLSAANPKFGRFDRFRSVIEQINLPPTILSCFDLIFLVEDRADFEEDRKLASHILKTHQHNEINFQIDQDFLRKYIIYARDDIHPKLSDDAIEMIKAFYLRIRQTLLDEDWAIPITPRQLESLIILSEANARIRLSSEVTVLDVKKIIKLYQNCLKQVGCWPEFDNIYHDHGKEAKSSHEITQMLIDDYKKS